MSSLLPPFLPRTLPFSALAGNAAARDEGLQPAHFAFVRARVQGVPLREAWLRYLQPAGDTAPPDAAALQATLQRILDAFAAAARRERRHGVARLVLVDPDQVPEGPVLPSLADFAAEHGLEDFSEAEQLEAYHAAFGRSDARRGRRARLIARQLEALRWLESLGPRTPRLPDAVDAWLPPPLADRIVAAGCGSLQALVERVNGSEGRWWRAVRGLGVAKAARVERWLQANAAVLGVDIAPHRAALAATAAAATTAAPGLPRAAPDSSPPAHVPRGGSPATRASAASSSGLPWPPVLAARLQRAPAQARLGAVADQAALDAWLAGKAGASPHTRRAYRREAERFHVWMLLHRGHGLQAATAADAAAYLVFLADPQPRADWCGSRHHPRWSPLWRPFEGPLSPAARRQAVAILRNLFAELAAAGGRADNPWAGVAANCARAPAVDAERHLTAAQCAVVEARLALLPDTAAHWRLRLAWRLLASTGLRVSELLALRGRDWLAPEAGTGAALRVGHGARTRLLALPPDLPVLLARSFEARGLPPPLHGPAWPDTALIGQAADWPVQARGLAAGRVIDPCAGIAPATLYAAFKALFRRCAQDARAHGDDEAAAALRRASGHWLRHTHGLQVVAAGMPLETAQHRLGHASPSTTRHYATPAPPVARTAPPRPGATVGRAASA